LAHADAAQRACGDCLRRLAGCLVCGMCRAWDVSCVGLSYGTLPELRHILGEGGALREQQLSKAAHRATFRPGPGAWLGDCGTGRQQGHGKCEDGGGRAHVGGQGGRKGRAPRYYGTGCSHACRLSHALAPGCDAWLSQAAAAARGRGRTCHPPPDYFITGLELEPS
jgi:hypothetical protein